MNFDKIFVIDTNIILEDAHQLITISQSGKNLIVLPETVIDELDSKKTGFGEINFQAREFGRILSEAEVIETEKTGTATCMSLLVKDMYIDIVSIKNYNLVDVTPDIVNDRKIIAVADHISKQYTNDVILLSNDIMCRIRAISLGVRAEGLITNKESLETHFIKEFHVKNKDEIEEMLYRQMSEIDEEYSPENYCYHFKCEDGNEKLAYLANGAINLIEKDTFNGLLVRPMNVGQKFAMAGMLDERIDIAVIDALAGSGKTLLALASGIHLVKKGQYDKIVYIRNSVESVDKAEQVGFLPGLEEKFRVYNYPLYDTLEYFAQKELKKSGEVADQEVVEEKIFELQKKYNIETMWPGAIRGRTISNAYVIIDEVQNFAKTSLQTVLSRMDKDCKVVCIGSNRQIDHPYINKYTNGLSVLVRAAKEENEEVNMFCTELNKVVRGKITQWTERIFEHK